MTEFQVKSYGTPESEAPETFGAAVDEGTYAPGQNGLLVQLPLALASATVDTKDALSVAAEMPGTIRASKSSTSSVAMALAAAAQAALHSAGSGDRFTFVVAKSKPVKDGWIKAPNELYLHFVDRANHKLAWFPNPDKSETFVPLAFLVSI